MEFPYRMFSTLKTYVLRGNNAFQGIINNHSRNYAAKKIKTKPTDTFTLEVETDAHKLVNYVCGTKLLQSEENIKIKPDSEYPDWLWTLHTGKPLKLSEMDPDTLQYWRRVRKLGKRMKNKLIAYQKWKLSRK